MTDQNTAGEPPEQAPKATRKPARKPATQDKAKAAKRRKAAKAEPPRLSHRRQPSTMPVVDWQRALRQQFGREQAFVLHNLGDAPVFSDFRVDNPTSGSHWRVSIRGVRPGDNRCACPDFASNDLGTCKHIEFTLATLARRRGVKAALKAGHAPAFSELLLRHGAEHAVRWRPGTDCPPALRQQAAALFDADGLLPADRLAPLPAFMAALRASGHAFVVEDEVLACLAAQRDSEHRAQALALTYPLGAADPALRTLLQVPLYAYQAEGALFAARRGRVLIADEMGLGKTAQAIAAAELLARHAGVERVLVVCPTSLKHQWQREFMHFAGRPAMVVQGLLTPRRRQWQADAFCKIANYETLARDLDDINAWAPELLVIDEAQRVKNWDTIAARALRRIPAPHAVVLTGTPLENRLEELLAIVQLVDPHRLGPTWRLRHDHQQYDDAGRVVGYRALDKLGATLAPVMLRRRKAEVLAQLPERIDKTLFVPLTAEQRAHHDEHGGIVARLVSRWRRTGFLTDADQRRLQCALQMMRMVCNSTWLLDHETDHGLKATELMTQLDELFEQPDAKAVVFSQWLGTHEVLQRHIRTRGWGHVLFHGGVPGPQRAALVDRFHSDPACRLFLSTDAGSVGLNLQHAAATVVNMDLPWNPAVLAQRIGRVHRMGQTRGVQVINLVAQGAIEEGMLGVLAFKQSLADGVLDGGEAEVFLQGSRLASFMKTVDSVTGAMGQAEAAPVAAPAPAAAPPVSPPSPVEAATATATAAPAPALPTTAQPAPQHADDPWSPLLSAGLQLLETLAQPGAAEAAGWVQADAASGQRRLVLPLPDPQTLRRLATGLAGLLDRLRPPG